MSGSAGDDGGGTRGAGGGGGGGGGVGGGGGDWWCCCGGDGCAHADAGDNRGSALCWPAGSPAWCPPVLAEFGKRKQLYPSSSMPIPYKVRVPVHFLQPL